MRNLSDEEMEELISRVTDMLGTIFGDSAKVEHIKGDKMNEIMSMYLNYPILELKLSRCDTQVNVDQCNLRELITHIPSAIGALLALIPEDERNEVLVKAINMDMSEDGAIRDKFNEMDEDD